MSSTAQRSFAGGELAPALYGRADLVKYATGLRTCRNFMVQRHGGVANRPGTVFVAPVKDATHVARLIDFVFSAGAGQSYVLEFGHQSIRFVQDGGEVLTPAAAAYAATIYAVGDLVSSGGVTYYCIQANSGGLHPPPDAAYWYPLGTVYEIPTPYLADDVFALQYVQTGDVLTIVHPSYAPRQLRRYSHTRWTLVPITFAPAITTPTNVIISSGGAASTTDTWYAMTAIDAETGEESLAGTTHIALKKPTTGAPIVLGCDAIPAAGSFNIFRSTDGGVTYGWIATTNGPAYIDDGSVVADYGTQPPVARNPFTGAGTYPAAVGFYQQRLILGRTTTDPEKVWCSQIGRVTNFCVSRPLADDDAVTFRLTGRQVNPVQHLIDLGRLLVFTESAEWQIDGDTAGVLTPAQVNPRQQLYHGSAALRPIIIGNAAIYLQARGSIVRDLMGDIVQGFRGQDLTVFAAHLFDGYTLVDWAFQQTPHSTLWAVRSDGTLLGLTYIREQEVWGWHRHDTDGAVESVCVVPEGTEDAVYLLVRRTVNGATVRYIERLSSRAVTATTDPRDLIFMDAALSYDGRNTTAETMTLSGGVAWSNAETLTCTRSVGGFTAGDVGNQVWFLDAAGATLVRCTIEGYTSGTIVTVRPQADVPVALRGVATAAWARAAETFTGLDHLEGKQVAVVGDAATVATPTVASYPVITVTGGAVTLPAAYAVVHVGLPYLSDLETLDLDSPQGPSLKARRINITKVTLSLESSRGFWAGPVLPPDDDAVAGLYPAILRDETDNYDVVALRTAPYDVTIEPSWNKTGRVAIRQPDPQPLTVLAAVPEGFIPAPS